MILCSSHCCLFLLGVDFLLFLPWDSVFILLFCGTISYTSFSQKAKKDL